MIGSLHLSLPSHPDPLCLPPYSGRRPPHARPVAGAHLTPVGVLHDEAQAVVGLEGVLQRLREEGTRATEVRGGKRALPSPGGESSLFYLYTPALAWAAVRQVNSNPRHRWGRKCVLGKQDLSSFLF